MDSSTTPSLSCNAPVLNLTGISVVNNEVPIKSVNVSANLNQAYTCVKVNLRTPNYLGLLTKDESNLIPVKGYSGFNQVRIEWFNGKDTNANSNVDLLPSGSPLVTQNPADATHWKANRPPIMRVQIMKLNSAGFALTDLDNNFNSTYSNTMFLYPIKGAANALNFTNDQRRTYLPSLRPSPVQCAESVASGYACSATLTLPSSISADDVAFLRVTSMYNKANYRVTLLNGGTTVNFDGVQPEIDSTGRANDLFRRVKSRVEMANVNFPYPEAAVDITGSLCKNFWVTDNPADHASANACTP
jgi:hypothetical protein